MAVHEWEDWPYVEFPTWWAVAGKILLIVLGSALLCLAFEVVVWLFD